MKLKFFLHIACIAIFIPIVLVAQVLNDDDWGHEPPSGVDIIAHYLEHGAKPFTTKDECWKITFNLLFDVLGTDGILIEYDVTTTKICSQSKYRSTYSEKLIIDTYDGFKIICRPYKGAPYNIGDIVLYCGKEFKVAGIKFCKQCGSDWSLILRKIHSDTSTYPIEHEYHDSANVERKETEHDPAVERFREGVNDKDIEVGNHWYHVFGDSCLSNSPKFYADKVTDWRFSIGGGILSFSIDDNSPYEEVTGSIHVDITFDGINWVHLVGEYCDGGLPFKKPDVKDLWDKR